MGPWCATLLCVRSGNVGGRCVGTAAQVVSKLAAHPGSNVRTMVADEAHGKLYTGSFDKSVRVFGSG
jgi:hypothetical protein